MDISRIILLYMHALICGCIGEELSSRNRHFPFHCINGTLQDFVSGGSYVCVPDSMLNVTGDP